MYGFTAGGPIHKDKTFFFVAFQQDTLRSTANFPLVVPTEAAVSTLRSLFPANPRLDLYLGFLGSLRGTASPIGLQLGDDPLTGMNRGVVQFATAPLALSASNSGPEWLARLDHNLSEAHRLTFRYIYNSSTNAPVSVYFSGFVTDNSAQNQNFLFTDHYTFSPSWTNEFRFSYARQDADQPGANFDPVRSRGANAAEHHHRPPPRAASGLIAAPGVRSILLGFQNTNNLLFQETQSKLSGRHTFRYGVEFLKQLAAQTPLAISQGAINYTDAAGYSALANFLDDLSGPLLQRRQILAPLFPSGPIPPDLLFPGHVVASAFAEPDPGTPL